MQRRERAVPSVTKNLPMKCLVVLLLVGSAATVLAQEKTAEDLRIELLEMARRDQQVRERPLPPLNSPDIQPLIEEMTKIDQANFRRLEKIINEFGWPGKHLVGEEASTAAWLIFQHAHLEQQKRYLPALRSAVGKGEARASNLAMTEDRILVGEGKNQLYGTQIGSDPNGKPMLHPVDDPANIDERRKAVGLPPIDEYLKHGEAELGMKIGRSNLVEQ
jgi:hypothetical protein